MKLRPIRTEAEYDLALAEADKYFDHEPEPGTSAGDRFSMLIMLIADYEKRRWPIEPLAPVDMIKGVMELKGYTQADLAQLLGSRARASEILARRRHLTLPMIWRLSREWKLPAESLIQPYELTHKRATSPVRVKRPRKARTSDRKAA
jgi:HTH-type transcriptional regulator/antitoxin HigA